MCRVWGFTEVVDPAHGLFVHLKDAVNPRDCGMFKYNVDEARVPSNLAQFLGIRPWWFRRPTCIHQPKQEGGVDAGKEILACRK